MIGFKEWRELHLAGKPIPKSLPKSVPNKVSNKSVPNESKQEVESKTVTVKKLREQAKQQSSKFVISTA